MAVPVSVGAAGTIVIVTMLLVGLVPALFVAVTAQEYWVPFMSVGST